MNWMDAGVKALFLKAYQQLSEGGIFIFEPQPWKSYKTTKSKTHQQSIKGSTEQTDAKPANVELAKATEKTDA